MTTTLERVLTCASLPSLPTVAIEVIELTRAESVKFSQIEAVVQNDPALAGKILKTVNSSYYGLSRPCPTIGRALKYLGLNTVKSLVLGFSLVDLTRRDGGPLDLMDYWQRCLSSAAAARRLAAACGACDPDEAFIAALMQDIGMLAMVTAIADVYAPVLESCGGAHDALPAAEVQALGLDHAAAGAALAEKWRLPEQIVEPIRHHHHEDLAEAAPIVRVVALACAASRTILGGGDDALDRLVTLAERWLGIGADEVRSILLSTAEDTRQLSSQFRVAIGSMPDVRTILAQAEEAMVAHQVRMQREAQELRQANEELSRQAHTDGLTGVSNRACFDEVLADRFGQMLRAGGSLGLVVADADRFKLLNDTWGHQAGDAVLVEMARRLERVCGAEGVVCRYGGEEFAVIVPGGTRSSVARLAERLREAICTAPFDVKQPGGASAALPVSASFGAAVVDPSTIGVLSTPQLLIRAADKALYAAKEAGRNCVRVFRPRASVPAA